MRIHLKLTNNTETVPFNYQHKLVGTIHKWIGINNIHDKLSMYSFSQLQKGNKYKQGLNFEHGANWFISSIDNSILKDMILNIKEKPEVCYGMEVKSIIIQETPNFENIDFFKIASPVLIKRNIENTTKHFLFTDKEASALLTETLQHKMKTVGLIDNSLIIEFVKNYSKATTKLITYKGIKNKANWCPVIIKGKPETKAFAWNVGIGNSTGIGFGSLI